MSIGDWFNQLGSNIKKGAEWLGQGISKGADWLNQNVVQPIRKVGQPIADKLGVGEAWNKTGQAIDDVNRVFKKQTQGGGASLGEWGQALGSVGRAGGEIFRMVPGVGGVVGNVMRRFWVSKNNLTNKNT